MSIPKSASQASQAFKDAKAWAVWLKANHAATVEVWIRFYKKDSGVQTISYAEALDEALCWGWIDGHVKALDAQSWIHRFTPRAKRSKWSQRNRDHVARLIDAGRMEAQGLALIEAAKADGRWDSAYAPPSEAKPPADFLKALGQDKAALAFFRTLNRANVYSIVYRLETAKKPETRERRLNQILAMMKDKKKFH